MTENGWTNDFVCSIWFEKAFIPFIVQRNSSGKPMLLILDGHGSHLTDRMIELAIEYSIHLFCLPPHTTHRLQPLDVGVFGPLQRRWEQRCDEVVDATGESIQIEDVVAEYLDVRSAGFQAQTILAAWAKSGIRPINPSIFTLDDFAPSADTSTESHLPPSFPTTTPSFPDLSSDDFEWHPSMTLNNDDDENSESDEDTESDVGTIITEEPEGPISSTSHGHLQEHHSKVTLRQTRSTSHTRSISSSSSVKSVQSFTLPDARDEIKRLRGQIEEIEAQRDAAEAHCMLAQRELSTLRFRMNRKEKKKNCRFRTGATLLTSEEGLQLWEVEKKRREEKRQEEAVTQAERKKATEERNIQRCEKATTGIFGGALKPKKKSELEDIASAFGLPFEGTKAVLMQRIVEHMEANANLENNPRFTGLFVAQKRTQTATNIAGGSHASSTTTFPPNTLPSPHTNHATASSSSHNHPQVTAQNNHWHDPIWPPSTQVYLQPQFYPYRGVLQQQEMDMTNMLPH